MPKKMDDELHRSIIEAAAQQGWRMRRGTKHTLFYPPDGGRPIAVSGTKVGRRAALNTRATFRRAGLDV